MPKPVRLDKNVISPEWPIRDTMIGWLIADRLDVFWVSLPIAFVIVALWYYTYSELCSTETIGIVGCPE